MRFNSNLGHYTNFVNFFGLSGLALPFGFRPDGLPFGITLIAHPYHDQELLEFGARWQRAVAAAARQDSERRCRRPKPIPRPSSSASRSPSSARI